MPLLKQCRSCGSLAPLVKAHIIPEAFFRRARDSSGALILLRNKGGNLPQRAPIGPYDKSILCLHCEAQFSAVDTYGIRVLLSDFERLFSSVSYGLRGDVYEGPNVDAELLLRFLVSVLWRASESGLPFCSAVDLGPHLAAGKLALSSQNIPLVFDAVLTRFRDENGHVPPEAALLSPVRERFDGVNCYRIFLGETVAVVKVDRRPFSSPLAVFSLRTGSPCRIVRRNFDSSMELRAMRDVATAADKRAESFRRANGAA